MANETSLGGVAWRVDADTAPATDSIQELVKLVRQTNKILSSIDQKTEGMGKSFSKTGKEIDKTNKSIDKTNKSIDKTTSTTESLTVEIKKTESELSEFNTEIKKTESELSEFNTEIKKTDNSLDGLDNGIKKTDKSTKNLDTSTSSASKTIDNFNNEIKSADASARKMSRTAAATKLGITGIARSAGQAGIQVQQFIGQIQGGQNGMLALSQQSTDLGFVLGAPLLGAIIGITASLAGMLNPNLFETKDALENISNAVDKTKTILTMSASGVANYTEAMQALASVSHQLAKIKLAAAIAEQGEASKEALAGVKTAVEDAFEHTFVKLKGMEDAFGNSSKEAIEAIYGLKKASADLAKQGATEETIGALSKALDIATKAGLSTTKSGRELINTVTDLIAKWRQSTNVVNTMTKTLSGGMEEFEKSSQSVQKYESLLESLTARTHKLRSAQLEQKKALTLEEDSYKKLSPEKQKAIADAYDNVIAIEKEKEAIAAKRKAQIAANKADAESRRAATKQVRTVVTKVQTDITGGVQSAAAYQAGIDQLKNLRDQDLANDETYTNAIINLSNKKIAAQMREQEIAERYTQAIINRGETVAEARESQMSRLDELRQADLINEESYTAAKIQLNEDYAKSVNSVNNAVINSITGLTSEIMSNVDQQSAAYRAAFAIQKAAAVAQTLIATELAATQVLAHDAGIFGLGAIVTSNIVRGLGYASAGVIAGTAIAGREHGGPVMAGNTYEVGERNKPELLMIPGNNGRVISNSDMNKMMSGSGGSQLNQTINNYAASDGYEVQTRGDGLTVPQVVDIVKSQMINPSSQSRRGMSQTSNVKTRVRVSKG
jgi:predicted  nucleic acid-binding Zn-ribbon protein